MNYPPHCVRLEPGPILTCRHKALSPLNARRFIFGYVHLLCCCHTVFVAVTFLSLCLSKDKRLEDVSLLECDAVSGGEFVAFCSVVVSSSSRTVWPWGWGQYVLSKRWKLSLSDPPSHPRRGGFLAVTVREPQILHTGLTVLMENGGQKMKIGRCSSQVERNFLCEQDVGFLNVQNGGTYSNRHAWKC